MVPDGYLKLAAAPVPSAHVALPLPARVLTRPEEVTALMRLLLRSATYTTPEASIATPAGLLKEAAAPWPSAKDALPLPARVDTFHIHGGSALSPAVAQFAGVIQGMAGAGVPPGQKYPTAHSVAFAGETDPAAHPLPGAALQAPVQVALVRFTAAP